MKINLIQNKMNKICRHLKKQKFNKNHKKILKVAQINMKKIFLN